MVDLNLNFLEICSIQQNRNMIDVLTFNSQNSVNIEDKNIETYFVASFLRATKYVAQYWIYNKK
ncbi:hypothetical protein BpHYR1_036087 [Brachionus plicatilis]|uniref:Uncharacterized protein n=1 Tax=Brachionus plicatilis TaxID=10195 RepID=A0A3M7R9J1_BRAPC|nr:hypothetical protein BpHYR1_036087 [Brachionus plicatilis]